MDLYFQHYPKEGEFGKSAYFYWYLYMQLVEDYGREHPLWKDFGDVRLPFWDWWCTHGEDLFMTGEKMGVSELETEEDIQQARSDGAYIVRIDPDCTRDYLMFYFLDFLDEKGIRQSAGRRRHKEEVKFARYPFHQRPDVSSLRISLEVWKLRHQQPKPTLYEIGCTLGLNPSAVIDEKNDTDAIKTDKKNVMNATVSRYIKWATNIKQNVAKGIFPKNDQR